MVTLAWARGIPVLAVARERDPRVRGRLSALAPDVVCVACWPRRVPVALLDLPHHGWLNLHPSLLPAHRGPAPLFWTLRAGDAEAGVTVHRMDATLDGGDILAQESIPMPAGISGAGLEDRCARAGGRLLARVLGALAGGTARPRPMDPSAGSYEPMPGPDDFIVTADRPARWAFNFTRGAAYWGGPIQIAVGGRRFAVAEALDYAADGHAADGEMAEPYRVAGDELWLRCAPGVLHVRLAG
jgi:methionyl-tRNA formyltransferase